MPNITLNPAQSNVPLSTPPVLQDWDSDPDIINIQYVQGSDMPVPVSLNIKVKDVLTTPSAANYNSLSFQSVIQSDDVTANQYLGAAGQLYTNGGYIPLNQPNMQGVITISFSNLNIIQNAGFIAYLYLRIYGNNANGTRTIISAYTVKISIYVLAGNIPVVNPAQLAFGWIEGQNYEVSQSFSINSPAWQISCPEHFSFASNEPGVVIANQPGGGQLAAGSGLKNLMLKLNLSFNNYTYESNPVDFTLNINGGQLEVPVEVLILNSGGMYFSTEFMEFTAYKGLSEAAQQTFRHTLHVDVDYVIECSPWITVTNSLFQSFLYKFRTVKVTPSANIEPGTYNGFINIKKPDGTLVHTITVVYNVYEYIRNPYRGSSPAFTLDNKVFEFLSYQDNTYFEVVLRATVYDFYSYMPKLYAIPIKVALYKRRQELNIGKLIDRLMFRSMLFNQHGSSPYREAEVILEVSEKSIVAPQYVNSFQVPVIKFIAGLNPGMSNGCGILDINKGASRVTAKGYFYLNLYITGTTAILEIYKNGELSSTTAMLPGIRSLRFNMSQLQAMQGDVFEFKINTGFISHGIILPKIIKVFPEGYTSNFIVWENEYKLKSVMEFTGKYNIKAEYENRTAALMDNLTDIIVKIENTKASKLIINTGPILKSEIASVESMCRAKVAGLYIGSSTRLIYLIPLQKSLVTGDIDREIVSFDIEFEIKSNYNAEVHTF